MLEILNHIAAIILCATIAYIVIFYGINWKSDTHNCITWTLWTILDVIALISTIKKGDDTTLLWTFTIGSGIIAVNLWIKRQFSLKKTEKATMGAVALCILIICFGNDDQSIWASSIATFASGVPYFGLLIKAKTIDNRKKWSAVFFLIAIGFALFAKLDDGVIPVFEFFCLVYWIIATALCFKEYSSLECFKYKPEA